MYVVYMTTANTLMQCSDYLLLDCGKEAWVSVLIDNAIKLAHVLLNWLRMARAIL